MTVAKLIKLLSKEDPKALVVLSSDSEGNSFSPATDVSSEPLLYHDGEISDPDELNSEDREKGEPCIIISP